MTKKAWYSKLAKVVRPIVPEDVYANLGQWRSRYLHEPDFEVFRWLNDVPGLVLDVGANRGCSAISVLRHTRLMQVYSIEPNRRYRWGLRLVRLLRPFRFQFRLVAAGDSPTRMQLYVPRHCDSQQSAYGSLDPAEFEKEHIREYLSGLGIDSRDVSSFQKISVPVIPLDDLLLSPDLIKLDVEGFELQALQGLRETLTRSYPALLIEMNHADRWLPLIESLGYVVYHYDPSTESLNNLDKSDNVLNALCLNKNSRSTVSQILLGKINTNE